MKITTIANKGQIRYLLDKSMHSIKSVKIAQKKVPFEVYFDIKQVPDRNYEMEVELKELVLSIKIQPEERPDHTLPRPFFVYRDGKILEQKFWKGHPFKLLGFSEKPIAGDMQVMLKTFLFYPETAEGMYPVFQDEDGKWFTSKDAVESIEMVRKGKKK